MYINTSLDLCTSTCNSHSQTQMQRPAKMCAYPCMHTQKLGALYRARFNYQIKCDKAHITASITLKRIFVLSPFGLLSTVLRASSPSPRQQECCLSSNENQQCCYFLQQIVSSSISVCSDILSVFLYHSLLSICLLPTVLQSSSLQHCTSVPPLFIPMYGMPISFFYIYFFSIAVLAPPPLSHLQIVASCTHIHSCMEAALQA